MNTSIYLLVSLFVSLLTIIITITIIIIIIIIISSSSSSSSSSSISSSSSSSIYCWFTYTCILEGKLPQHSSKLTRLSVVFTLATGYTWVK